MKVYTKGGDRGTTSLVGGTRVSKDSPRVEAYGTVDELMAHVGLLHDQLLDQLLAYPTLSTHCDELVEVLNTLMNISAIVATEKGDSCSVTNQSVAAMEVYIDRISAELPPITKFTLACGHPLVSQSHVCRTVCRRAERRITAITHETTIDPNVTSYINRLSDYLYVLGRKLGKEFNIKERYWLP